MFSKRITFQPASACFPVTAIERLRNSIRASWDSGTLMEGRCLRGKVCPCACGSDVLVRGCRKGRGGHVDIYHHACPCASAVCTGEGDTAAAHSSTCLWHLQHYDLCYINPSLRVNLLLLWTLHLVDFVRVVCPPQAAGGPGYFSEALDKAT